MSSETKSRVGRTAEQVVNEWRESGSQDWGQLVSAINYWAVTDMCPALESSSSADPGGRETAYHARGAGREDATLQFRITGYLADNDSLTDEQLSDLLRDCRSAMGEIVLANRCMFHRNIPPMNKVCADGAECPICAQHNPPDRRLVREPGADTGTTPLHEAAIDLLNHIENILDDENFDKIDSKLWNRVTGLAAAEPGTTGAEGLAQIALADEMVDKLGFKLLEMIRARGNAANASLTWPEINAAIDEIDGLIESNRAATQRAPVTPPAPLEGEGQAFCLDCGKEYGGDDWLDLTLVKAQWLLINPNDGGVLCANCMIARASKLPHAINITGKITFASDYDEDSATSTGAPAPVTTRRDEALTTAILARKLNASGHSNASFAHGYTTACDDILKALLAAKEPRG